MPGLHKAILWRDYIPVEVITLSGTSGTPNEASDSDNTSADAAWEFLTDGTVDKIEGGSTTQFQTGVEWSDFQPTPGQDYWVRAQNDAGSNPTTGPALNTWHKVAGSGSANRRWTWQRLDFEDGPGTTTGTLQVDIATDASGTNIVATGYYRGSATIV